MYCWGKCRVVSMIDQILEGGVGLNSCGKVGCNHMFSIESDLVESHVMATTPQ